MKSPARTGPEWADLVFHVLTHVPASRRLASSLWNARYVAWCERHLGPASARSLGDDVAVLSHLLTSHELTARLQWTAFLFPDATTARTVAARELRELPALASGVNPHAARALTSDPAVQNAAELLRACAELEAPFHARLPPAGVPDVVSEHLTHLVIAAPYLVHSPVEHLRALTRHGRALGRAIYVGVPAEDLGLDAEWVALQAAHEATVVEVGEAAWELGVPLGERDVERAALVVLATRVERTAWGDAHARWWAETGLPPLTELRDTLDEPEQRVVTRVLGGSERG